MFVEYTVDHAKDGYQMLNFHTKRIINTSDVVHLKKNYKTWSNDLIPSSEQEDDNNEDFINKVETLNLEERNVERVQVAQEVKDRV
jgi:hypothetical protein